MYEGDELMEDVVSKMDKLKKEFNKDSFYDNEALLNKASYDKGIEQGGKDKSIAIAKKMLEEDFDVKIISRITELSIEEIEEIRKDA